MFYKKGVLEDFTKFTGKQLCQLLFLNNVAGLRRETFVFQLYWPNCYTVCETSDVDHSKMSLIKQIFFQGWNFFEKNLISFDSISSVGGYETTMSITKHLVKHVYKDNNEILQINFTLLSVFTRNAGECLFPVFTFQRRYFLFWGR